MIPNVDVRWARPHNGPACEVAWRGGRFNVASRAEVEDPEETNEVDREVEVDRKVVEAAAVEEE